MRADQDEDRRYSKGFECPIDVDEKLMFQLLKKYGGNKPLSILDVGCGDGSISQKLTDFGHKVSGIDFSTEAIKLAKKRGLNVKQANLDEGIPFKDQSFNVVWAGDIIEHVYDPINALTESARVLKKNGLVFVSVPNDLSIGPRVKTALGISYQHAILKKRGSYKHHTFFSEALIRFILKRSGFKVVTLYKIGRNYITNKKFFTRFLSNLFAVEFIVVGKKIK